MRNSRLAVASFALLLLAAASTAHAHGMAGVIQPLVLAAAVVGAVGGLVAGLANFHPGYTLLGSVGTLVSAELIYLIAESQGPMPNVFGFLGFLFLLTAFAGGIPLVVAFFMAFAISSGIREQIAIRRKDRDVAP